MSGDAAEIAHLIGHGLARGLRERFTRWKVDGDSPLRRAYPPDKELQQEYEKWRRQQS